MARSVRIRRALGALFARSWRMPSPWGSELRDATTVGAVSALLALPMFGSACASGNQQPPSQGDGWDAAALNADNLNGASCALSDSGPGSTCRSSTNGYKAVAVGRDYACVLAMDGTV